MNFLTFKPLNAVDVAKEGVDLGVEVARVAGGRGVGGGRREDVDVVGQLILEHGARFTSLHVHHQLVEPLLVGHILKSLMKKVQIIRFIFDFFFLTFKRSFLLRKSKLNPRIPGAPWSAK